MAGVFKLKTAAGYIEIPTGATDHNLLSGLQGGAAGEFYHLAASASGLHDADLASPSNGDVIQYNSGTGLWEHAVGGSSDGWIVISDTLTYASATTFTVPTDLTLRFQKGTKIKLTNGTVKYFYVTLSAYGAPNTTVTVTGGSNYALAAGAITSPYYSYIDRPQAFPEWFDWTPTMSALAPMTWTGTSVTFARFAIKGLSVTAACKVVGTTGGTASVTLYVSAPVEAAKASANPGMAAYVSDAGAGSKVAFSFITAGTPDLLSFRLYDSANWTLGANSTVSGFCVYELE